MKEKGTMKKILSLSLCAFVPLCLLVSGCATENSVKMAKEARLAYQSFLAQPRTFSSLELAGSNMEFRVSGASRIVMQAPLNPLEVMPRDPDAVGRIADAAKNTVLGAACIATLGKVATQGPTIVTQPAPTIVRPEVVNPVIVPAATATP